MTTVQILPAAAQRIGEIYTYTQDKWGDAQAEKYETGLFSAIEAMAYQLPPSRQVSARFGFNGFTFRYERHFVYWRYLADGTIGIVTVLHERMHQMAQLRRDVGP